MSFAEREIGDPLLPVSSLHLLVPPLKLLSAAMWQVLQQQDVLHYGKLEEFVCLVTEAFPELLSESQRTELTLGLQSGCKTDPALEVLLWEFLSTLDQLLPVPDLTQTVSWLSAAPSVLEVCLQSVYYPDQLKTLLRHKRSLGQLDMNAKLPFIEEYKLSSMSRPPCQRVVDSTKLTNTNSQSESITDCMNCLRPASSGEDIQAESVMDSSDYTGMEPTSISNRCEDIDEKRERKSVYLMSRDKKDLLTNMKEEEDGESQSVKIEREDGVKDEEELWKEEEETDEQMEGHAADLVAQTDKLLKNGIKSEHAQREGEELSTLVTSCLLKKPRVLIRRLEISNSSLPVSPPPHLVACQRGQRESSPWGQHELSPLRGNGSLTQKKGQVVTRKRNTISQLERPPKMLPSSSENGICAEASLISPVISPRNQNTGSDHTGVIFQMSEGVHNAGQSVEVPCQVFACSQCPFVHTEEVNLHQHIEKVHPEEVNTTLLVPPLQLLSAAMWQVLQQQDVLHYGKLEEFVSLVTEAFPELLSESQRTELTLGLQSGCKTDPALEVLLWEFLSTLDQLLPVPDLTQTVSWLSAAPSVLEVCLQSVYYPDQLKTLLRHNRSLGQLDMNAKLPFIEEYKLSPMSRPPCQRVVDSTKLTNTNSQSESITDCMNCLRPASSGEDIQAESMMDSSDYTGMEPTSISNRCEDIDEKRERKTVYLMSREKKDLLTNMKEEEDGERQSVKMEREDGVRDEEELWKEEEETDEQMEGHAADLVAQTDKLLKNGIKSEHAQLEGQELSTLVTSCLLKKPRVLIRRLEISNSSLPVSPPPHLVACQRGQRERSPWGQHELSPLRGNGSLTQKKGQVVTQKRNTIGQLARPPKMLSSENGVCAEASLISPVISPRNQNPGSDHTGVIFQMSEGVHNAGQSVEVPCQVFACSQCPFVLTEEVNLHQHIEKFHPEEVNTTLLVPPLKLLSAAMWQVLQQQDVLHYGKLEEFVSLVTEAFPELLSESQRTELTLGLQQSGCKTDPALEVLLWEFLSTLDQLLPVPDLTQTVSWLSAAPSLLEVSLQSVYYPDQLKTLLRHHRSLGQLDMNAKLPFIEEYKLSSMSRPPCQRVVDSTKLTNTNSQSESITDCMNCLRPASSGEDIQAESMMDSSDYTGMEPTICAEASLISPVISPRNQNPGSDHTGQTVEVSCQVFACSQCPFVLTEEVNLHQHIEKVHPEEVNTTVSDCVFLRIIEGSGKRCSPSLRSPCRIPPFRPLLSAVKSASPLSYSSSAFTNLWRNAIGYSPSN
ncbi:hypothetical protein SKAU_G00183560 [Synaphobranchus kaupii]|uniref:C2H2-type domain-containing protein n=1 Tax=Synaphobranchus kaupii TaxID=118154 RepID=A0A9Q1FC93_SYNKA|nr:hypothetical protein SKAU_G00183560 [Synaphobranchus kaupii]